MVPILDTARKYRGGSQQITEGDEEISLADILWLEVMSLAMSAYTHVLRVGKMNEDSPGRKEEARMVMANSDR